MPKLSAQITCRFKPKRLACKNDVYGNEHHPSQHDLPLPALRCGWQGNDPEHFGAIYSVHVRLRKCQSLAGRAAQPMPSVGGSVPSNFSDPSILNSFREDHTLRVATKISYAGGAPLLLV